MKNQLAPAAMMITMLTVSACAAERTLDVPWKVGDTWKVERIMYSNHPTDPKQRRLIRGSPSIRTFTVMNREIVDGVVVCDIKIEQKGNPDYWVRIEPSTLKVRTEPTISENGERPLYPIKYHNRPYWFSNPTARISLWVQIGDDGELADPGIEGRTFPLWHITKWKPDGSAVDIELGKGSKTGAREIARLQWTKGKPWPSTVIVSETDGEDPENVFHEEKLVEE